LQEVSPEDKDELTKNLSEEKKNSLNQDDLKSILLNKIKNKYLNLITKDLSNKLLDIVNAINKKYPEYSD